MSESNNNSNDNENQGPCVSTNEIATLVAEVNSDTDALLLDVTVPQTRRLNQEQDKYCKEFNEHFSLMGLKFEDLSPTAQADINFLAGMAVSLGVSEPVLPKMTTALSEICDKQFYYNLASLAIQDEEARLSELHQSQMTVQFQLKRLLEESRSKVNQLAEDTVQSKEKTDFFTKKCSQYVDSIQTCVAALQKNSFNEAMSHQNLAERRKKLDEQQAKVSSLKTELEAFHNLPPNIDIARQELDKCKEELRRLDEEITTHASESVPFQY